MQEELRLDPDLEYRSIEDGDLYSRVFPKDTRGRVCGLGLLPHACKTVEIARQSAMCTLITEENIGLRASNAELIARMDALAGQMEAMQQKLDSQSSSVHQSGIVGGIQHPENSVQSPLRRIHEPRQPIPESELADVLAQTNPTPAPARSMIPPRGAIVCVQRTERNMPERQ